MFTGIVEALGTIAGVREDGPGRRLIVAEPTVLSGVAVGASVALNGCCLTVVESAGGRASFEAGPETLKKTNLGELAVGDLVNLERALAADGRLGGHFVQGHVDGVGRVRSRDRVGDWETIWFEVGELARMLIPKGSIAVDGVSLTVVEIAEDSFSVALIPHTLKVTTLGKKLPGSSVNIEVDMIGKYILSYLKQLDLGAERNAAKPK